MHHDLTLLVLGVGGNVSQGILKALAQSTLRCRVIGACTTLHAMGLHTVDKAYRSPLAYDAAFLPWLVETCRREQVVGVLSGVEPVLEVLAREAATLRRETGAVALVSPPDVLAIGDDKLETNRWLAAHGLPAPRSAVAEDRDAIQQLVEACGYPLVAKPRRGKGAAGIFLVECEDDLARLRGHDGYLVQEHLGDEEHEYTAATLSDRMGAVRGCIVLRRTLQAGTTYRAVAGEFPLVRQAALGIAEALRPLGPCNMQFRLRGDEAVCFEINVRFSGTTPIRARFGFNDVEAAVRHFILGEAIDDLPHVVRGAALRYWNELYADPAALDALAADGVLDAPAGYIEDYGAAR